MRHFDFSPLYRATVGFDQIADLMDRAIANDVGQNTYPPYNIEKTDDIMMGMVGPINLGDSITVQLSSGETKLFHNTSLEVIND